MINCLPFLKGKKLEKHLQDLNARRVAIWGVPRSTPDHIIANYFEQFGRIENAFVLSKPATDKPDAFVVFASKKDSKKVLRIKEHTIGGMTARVTQF